MTHVGLGLKEALRLTLEAVRPLPAEDVPLMESGGRVVASDLYALVDSPSTNASLKDGYALSHDDVGRATTAGIVALRLLGSMAAGCEDDIRVEPGTIVKVLTGAPVPTGADAVVAEEDVRRQDNEVLFEASVRKGANILPRGTDVKVGHSILRAGRRVSPGLAGLLAAAGHNAVPVFRQPLVALLGTGDEIVAPGMPLSKGKLYASNITTLSAWCRRYQMRTRMAIVKDDYEGIALAIARLSAECDVLITSGGAWTGDRDMVARVLGGLGWTEVFHHIRVGPGKATGFGMLYGKPVFILPGGPPSNLMGFLQIALPGLLALSGHQDPGLPRANATLASELGSRETDWTDFVFGNLEPSDGLPVFHPLRHKSRLSSMAESTAIACIAEGEIRVPAGSVISVQSLR